MKNRIFIIIIGLIIIACNKKDNIVPNTIKQITTIDTIDTNNKTYIPPTIIYFFKK